MQKQAEYAEAMSRKYPEQVVIVIAKDQAGKANPVTLGRMMTASSKPAMLAIAVAAGHYSTGCIRHSKCFSLAFPSAEQGEAALFFGSKSGRDIDKLAEFDCATEPAEKIDSVLLSDAAANFECELESETVAGDHVIFVGRVVCSHVNTQANKRLYTIGPGHKLGPAS